jgi:predicted ATP-binding protein involved in virulence
MRVTRLSVTNLRAIQRAELLFRPGFNLIVGVNGVGKTSVLDALCACLSPIVKHMNRLRAKASSLSVEDIRIGTKVMTLECGIETGGGNFSYLIHMPRESSVPQEKKSGMPREQVHETPGKSEFVGEAATVATGEEPEGRALAVLFSTRRAVPSERAPSKGSSAGDFLAAFADAFSNRELQLGEFAAWMRVQEVLKSENPGAARVLAAFEEVMSRFLPGYSNLRVSDDGRPTLQIDRGTTTVKVRQLSDGERGTLALVLDLTRRLSQANPNMPDPGANAEAVVLIDEIDLHLHPKWQRLIVKNLTTAFPKCQFIATTHSPQVIGEVQHDRIQIIADGKVYSPLHSFGVDSSRVLEEIMGAGTRTAQVEELLVRLSRAIGDGDRTTSRSLLTELAENVGEDDPEVTRLKTLLEFEEGEK